MGSVGDDFVGATQWPATILPRYNDTTTGSSANTYCNVTAELPVPTVTSVDSLLQRFAGFMHAVTASHEATFVADNGTSKPSLSLVYAAAQSCHGTEAVGIRQQLIDVRSLDVDGINFGIRYQLSAGNATANDPSETILTRKLLQPLVLSVVLSPEERNAHMTLYLREDYGPPAAARHLLDLAIAYLSPEIDLAKTDKSHLFTPFQRSYPTPEVTDVPPSLHLILEETTRRYPHNLAIEEVTERSVSFSSSFKRRTLTYSELNEKVSLFADQLEHVLDSLEWPNFQNSTQKMIPIFMPNSTELNISMNAISNLGHCFCVLAMDSPEERLRDLLQDLDNCVGILGVGGSPWSGTRFGQQIIWIDFLNPFGCLNSRPIHSTSPVRVPPRTTSPDDLAYVVYTSGSTGKPKGVIVHQRVAMAYLSAWDAGAARLPTGPRLRWMVMSAPTFDIVLMDNFMPLLKGGTVCIAERQLLLSSPETIIHELRATATFTVSSMALLLRPERIPSLTTLFVGGELIGQRVVEDFAQRRDEKEPYRRFFAVYGPTESTVIVTHHLCYTDSRPSILGAPHPGTRLVVLDQARRSENGDVALAPLGVAGELAISSPQLSSGYLNKPQETAQAFVQDAEFGTLYKTGDRVRVVWAENGDRKVEYLGRMTAEQVKLNGRRLELAEIENVLARTEAAAHLAVLMYKSKLIAFVMPWGRISRQDEAMIEAQCRAQAERFLPVWMQPRQYRVVDQLPYSANGKLDRKALENMVAQNEEPGLVRTTTAAAALLDRDSASASTTNDRYQDTTSSIDNVTVAVLQALIDAIDCVDVQPSTFLADTGIDSLRALLFLQELEDQGIVELEVKDVLTAVRVQDLIKIIHERGGRVDDPNIAPNAEAQFSQEDVRDDVPARPTNNDTASIVREALFNTLQLHVQGSTSLKDVGLDSLRTLLFLQGLEDQGIEGIEISDVLSAETVDSLIETIDAQRTGASVETSSVTIEPNSKESRKVLATTAAPTTILSSSTNVSGTIVDGVDVGKIGPEDGEEVFELSIPEKLRHFDHHCRGPALAALGLKDSQVEEVLPVTSVQTRCVAMGVDPEYYDPKRLIGRPQMTHLPYKLPKELDPARFQRAVEAVLPRYDCFRAVFTPVTHCLAPFAQVLLKSSEAKIPKVEVVCDDTDADTPGSLWRETINAVQLAAENAMSIDRLSITVSWVWSPDRARCVWIMTLFHAVYDATQLGYMYDAIVAEYEQPGCKPPLDLLPSRRAVELTLSYDWVSTLVYWAGRLGGVPSSRLGSQRPHSHLLLADSWPGYDMTHMRSVYARANMTMEQLFRGAAAMSSTMLTVVGAAWASVLAQTFTAEQRDKTLDVQFGTVLNGRRTADALRCMAPMLAALPLRVVVDADRTQRRITNREVCALLAAQWNDAHTYLQIPCPTIAQARTGNDRFDTVMALQTLQPDTSKGGKALRELPGWNYDDSLMPAFKEIDIGFPLTLELYPGRSRWDEKMVLRAVYNTDRLGFLTHDWVLGALSALDEAIVCITSAPDAVFFAG